LGPRAYISQAMLLVRLGRENATLDTTTTLGNAPVIAVPQNRENDINSVIEIIKSRILFEKVVDTIGPDVILGTKSLEPAGEANAHPTEGAAKKDAVLRYLAIRKLASGLTVEAVKKATIIALSYKTSSTKLAQLALTKITKF